MFFPIESVSSYFYFHGDMFQKIKMVFMVFDCWSLYTTKDMNSNGEMFLHAFILSNHIQAERSR